MVRGALLTAEKPARPGSPTPSLPGSDAGTASWLRVPWGLAVKGQQLAAEPARLNSPKGPPFPTPACRGLPLSPGLSVAPVLTAGPRTPAQVPTPTGAQIACLDGPESQKALWSFSYVSVPINDVQECSPGFS